MKLSFLVFYFSFHLISSEVEVIKFNNDDIQVQTEDEASLSAEDLATVQDHKDTGSYLFKFENEREKALPLSLNIQIKHVMTSSSSYVRIHPLFIECLQKVITHANNRHGLKVVIDSAYKTNTDIGSSTSVVDLYAAAGTGAVLSIDGNGDILKIAEAATKFCPTILASGRGFLGIVMRSDSVHLHMTGSVDSGPHFDVDGYTGIADFPSWATEQIDNALEPVGSLDCSRFSELNEGGMYPSTVASAEEAVGSADSDVNSQDDYLSRLVVYPGSNISPNSKKLMSPRMFEVLRQLQRYAKNSFPSSQLTSQKLQVDEADSLHLEGRMALLALSGDTSAASMSTLTKLAMCAGASYVKHNGDHIEVAVKKQSGIKMKKVKFLERELIKVTPPKHLSDQLSLPEELQDDPDEYPIFDSEFQANKLVSELTTLGDYASPSTRYIRLHPTIVQCYDSILRHEKKWNNGVKVPIILERAYRTLDELNSLGQLDEEPDARSYKHALGQALHLRYDPNFTPEAFPQEKQITFDHHRLVRVSIALCGPLFYDIDPYERYGIGIGIFEDGVYIDFRAEYELWFDDFSLLPEGKDYNTYYDEMEERHSQAIEGNIVSPEEPVKACAKDHVPQRQSLDFRFEQPLHVQEKRRKRQAGDETEESCVPETDTEFCQKSKQFRDDVVDHLWHLMNRKHIPENRKADFLEALTGCFGACGTCLLGQVYEDKTMHCSNILHWANFAMSDKPNEKDYFNFYHLSNYSVRQEACSTADRHCLDKSELYAVLASSVYEMYRPDPTTSIELELYSKTENPLPVVELLYELYAISALGTVTVWVSDEKETSYLRAPLRVAMLYNKDVTDVVVKVVNEDKLESVHGVMESMVADFVREGCPLNTRDYVAPYTVEVVESGTIVKRDTRTAEGFSFGDKLLLRRKHFEYHWYNSVRR